MRTARVNANRYTIAEVSSSILHSTHAVSSAVEGICKQSGEVSGTDVVVVVVGGGSVVGGDVAHAVLLLMQIEHQSVTNPSHNRRLAPRERFRRRPTLRRPDREVDSDADPDKRDEAEHIVEPARHVTPPPQRAATAVPE